MCFCETNIMIRRIILFFILMILTVNIVGCKNNDEKYNKNDITYSEKKCESFNSKYDIDWIYDIKTLNNNKVAVLASDTSGNLMFYESNDCNNWTEEKIEFDNVGKGICDANISLEGNIAFTYCTINDEVKSVIRYTDNQIKELDMIDHSKVSGDIDYYFLSFASNGDILYTDLYCKKVTQLDGKTQKLKKEYCENDFGGIQSFTTKQNEMILLTSNNEIIKFDLDSGKQNYKEKAPSQMKEAQNLIGGKNNIYYLSNSGIYSYDENDNSTNIKIKSSESTFADMNYIYSAISEKGKDGFIAAFHDQNDRKWILTTYEKKKSKEKDTVVLYSLYDNEMLRQNISYFNRNNDNIIIDYQVGITGDNGKNESDEIKALNVQIMNGKGPDIINLDGLPYESYYDKGILENISDIENLNNNTLFTNIINSYYEDNKINMVPIRFLLPLSITKDGNKVDSLETFQQAVKDLGKENSSNTVDVYEPSEVIKMCYFAGANNWINGDNTINRNEIKMFLQYCKSIYDISQQNMNEEYYKEHNDQKKASTDKDGYEKYGYLYRRLFPLNFINKTNYRMDIGNLYTLNDFGVINAICSSQDNYNYSSIKDSNGNLFIANTLLGINTKSSKINESKQIINNFLSSKYQEIYFIENLPVNKEAFNNELKDCIDGCGDGAAITTDDNKRINIDKPTEEEINYFMTIVENVNSYSKCDTIILNQVIVDIEKYLSGEKNIDKATDDVANKIQLYLSEK